ncbi:MAG TPA: hypothetical protein VMW73_10765 [Spirochaetia bacterium]|nr:hypothetical protein [Spirochaetia bacterium]
MFRRPLIRILLLVVWCVVLALAVGLTLKLVHQHRLTQSYSAALGTADADLASDDLPGTVDALRTASSSAQTATEWLSILRRARDVSMRQHAASAPWQLVEELGRKAVTMFPGNQDLWAVVIWAEIKDGKGVAASDSATYLSGSRYESLRVQALLQADSTLAAQPTSKNLELLSNLPASHDPNAFRVAGDLTGDNRFYVDMVLLLAQKSVADALREFGRYNLSQIAPSVGVLLAYDSGDFSVARAYLQAEPGQVAVGPEMVLLQADMAMAENRYTDAEGMYQSLIQQAPDVSPVPYQNLAYIAVRKDQTPETTDASVLAVPQIAGKERLPRLLSPHGGNIADRLLAQGLHSFPDDPDLIRTRAQLLLTMGNSDLADTIVGAYLSDHPQDSTMRLFNMLRLMPQTPPTRITSLIWDLINSDPGNELIGQTLANRLRTIRDYNALSALVGRYPNPPLWVQYYAGITAAAGQDTSAARARFTVILNARGDWQAAFDIALTYLQEGSVGQAQKYLDTAEQAADNAQVVGGFRTVSGYGPAPRDLAKLEYYRAEVLASQAEQERALEVARKAQGLAPDSIDTSILLQKLEAAIQR